MALWPNGRYMTRSTYKGFGVAPGLDARIKAQGDRNNRFTTLNKTCSTPDGYGARTPFPPIIAGSISAQQPVATAMLTGNALQGGPMDGAGAMTFAGDGMSLSLTVGLSGTAGLTLAADGNVLAMTIGLDGTATWTLTGSSALAMIVPFEGSGAVAQVTGVSDLRGLLSMSGGWTPFTELSPEGLANAVMGRVIEAGFTFEEIVRILAAQAAGSATGLEGTNPQFKGLDGTTIRIDGTYSAGVRTIDALNGA